MRMHDPVVEEVATTPEFELECLYDDSENPSELTVFCPEEGKLTTEWITVDRGTAVPLESVR
jgi:hypothetical protein